MDTAASMLVARPPQIPLQKIDGGVDTATRRHHHLDQAMKAVFVLAAIPIRLLAFLHDFRDYNDSFSCTPLLKAAQGEDSAHVLKVWRAHAEHLRCAQHLFAIPLIS